MRGGGLNVEGLLHQLRFACLSWPSLCREVNRGHSVPLLVTVGILHVSRYMMYVIQ